MPSPTTLADVPRPGFSSSGKSFSRPSRSGTILPRIPETVEGSAPWLRVQDGQLEQRVFLCNLPEKYNQYEGRYGWAEVAAIMPRKESLIQVRLDS